MSNISTNDLKKGDILLFKGDQSEWISAAIMLLTNSDVSHAALCYDENKLADEVLTGVGVHNISDALPNDPKGHCIYVRRYANPDISALNPNPVTNAAAKYISEGEPYDKASLLLLALILLYKKFTPSIAMQAIMIWIFQKAASVIDTLINEWQYPGKHPMVCSQFVFQCYEDADCHLDFLPKTVKSDATMGAPESQERFIDLVMKHVSNNFPDAETAFKLPQVQFDIEENLIKTLSDEIKKITDGHMMQENNIRFHKSLVGATKTLADKIVDLYNKESDKTKDSLSVLAYDPALFVTPENLKNGFTGHLKEVGMAWINRY